MEKKLWAVLVLGLGIWMNVLGDTITIRGDSWAPHNNDPKDGSMGYMVDIAKYILEKNGHIVDYSIEPWSRAMNNVLSGEIDAVVGASKEDSEELIFPKVEEGIMTGVFFVKKGSKWVYKDMKSLESISLGVIQDYTYGNELDKYIENNKKDSKKIQSVPGDNALESNIRKLIAGRIDVLIEDEFVMKNKQRTHAEAASLVAVGVYKKSQLYVAFSPKKPKSNEYAKLISDGVEEMRKNGKLKEILLKYDLSDWK